MIPPWLLNPPATPTSRTDLDRARAREWLTAAVQENGEREFVLGVSSRYHQEYIELLANFLENSRFSKSTATVIAIKLALHYYKRAGGPDYTRAKYFFEMAASGGNSDAMNWLGVFHEFGFSGPVDLQKARAMYQAASAQGNELAKVNLSSIANT